MLQCKENIFWRQKNVHIVSGQVWKYSSSHKPPYKQRIKVSGMINYLLSAYSNNFLSYETALIHYALYTWYISNAHILSRNRNVARFRFNFCPHCQMNVFVGFEFLTALSMKYMILRVVSVFLFSFLGYSSTLKVEPTHSSEKLISVYKTVWHYCPDCTLQVCFWW